MPYRRTPIVVGEIYHVFNRGIARQPIFFQRFDYQRAMEVARFYVHSKPALRFSFFNRLTLQQKNTFWISLKKSEKLVDVLSFCFMPNHIHFLLREAKENGIARFMSNFQNSYAKYFNTKTERTGALFESMFKLVRIESEQQLIHICRYIHLNPLTSYILREPRELETYPWSSFPEYLSKRDSNFVETVQILKLFSSIDQFVQFTLDQVDYQRKLNSIKHLIHE